MDGNKDKFIIIYIIYMYIYNIIIKNSRVNDSEEKYCVRFKWLANLAQIHLENYFWNEKILNQAPMLLFLVNCPDKSIRFFLFLALFSPFT